MMVSLADPNQVARLRSLAGNPLTVLAAAAICTADLFTAGYLRAVLGTWDQLRISNAIGALIAVALVESVERYTYRLTPRGQAIAAALSVVLTPGIPESLPPTHQPPLLEPGVPTRGIPESHSHQLNSKAAERPEIAAVPDDSGIPRVTPRVVVVDISDSSIDPHTTTTQALEALRALRIPQARAAEVLARSPFSRSAIVAQAQAWLAYRDSGSTRINRALVPNLAAARIQAGDLCPYDPPAAELDRFKEQAAAGGDHQVDPIFDDDAENIPEAERLWRSALEQLRGQTQAATYELLANTALVAGDQPDAYRLLCPSRYTHDWISTRAVDHIRRELAAAAGRAVTIEFSFPQK